MLFLLELVDMTVMKQTSIDRIMLLLPNKIDQRAWLLAVLVLCSTLGVFSQPTNFNRKEITKTYLEEHDATDPAGRVKIDFARQEQVGEWIRIKNWNEGTCVVAESDSIVWVGTTVGLLRWNVSMKTYQKFDESNGLPFTNINALAIDRSKHLWIATNLGIVEYANGVFKTFNYLNANLPNTSFIHLAIDSKNKIYVAYDWYIASNTIYYGGGIAMFDSTSWSYINIPNSNGTFGPTAICVYHDTVWIGATDNFYFLDNNSVVPVPRWNSAGALSIAVDYQDSLWVQSARQRMLKYVSGNWQVIIDADSEHYYCRDIWNDPRGGLWLSMGDLWGAGVGPYRLDIDLRRQGFDCNWNLPKGVCPVFDIPGQFYAHHALSANSQFFASKGSINYLGQVRQGGLFKFNGSSWEVFQLSFSLQANMVYGLGCGLSGELYVSTSLFTQKTDGQTWETIGELTTGILNENKEFRFAPNCSLFTNHDQLYSYVTGLDFDGYGNLWTAYGTIKKYSWPSLSSMEYSDSIMGIQPPPGHYITPFWDVSTDKNEHIWSAAEGYGGVMYDLTNWHIIPSSDTTLPNYSYDLVFADSKNRKWFATNQISPNYGFSMYDGTQWRTYYSPQSYSISYVYQITEDHFGNIWLATKGGLLKFDGSSFFVFNRDNSPLEGAISSVIVDLRGNIWIGTNSGLYVYNPSVTIELGPYSFTSPVDSLSISNTGKFAKAEFIPLLSLTSPVKYILERGHGTHKFWAVAESDSFSTNPARITIIDSSILIDTCYYRIKEVSFDGKVRYSSSVQFNGGTVGVSLQQPIAFRVSHNYPNPFNPSTTIKYQVPTQAHVTLKIFDVLGREVATLVNGVEEPGYKSVTFSAHNLASGVYYYRLQSGSYVETKKLVMLR